MDPWSPTNSERAGSRTDGQSLPKHVAVHDDCCSFCQGTWPLKYLPSRGNFVKVFICFSLSPFSGILLVPFTLETPLKARLKSSPGTHPQFQPYETQCIFNKQGEGPRWSLDTNGKHGTKALTSG